MSTGKKEIGTKTFSIGLIADCQYCNVIGQGQRKYSLSDRKLQICVNHFNTMDLSYVVHLGDFIDKDWESFDVVGPIYKQLSMPAYHVLGNHDFSVENSKKASVVKKMGLDSAYYHFSSEGWRFIVLNGNDISFHAYPEDSDQYLAAEQYYAENQIESPKWNGALGQKQMIWLEETLTNAKKQEENVILFCHFPVYPENQHNLWNAKEVTALLERYSNVKAYINGHNHEGNYAEKKGIHYLTMKGMVDTEETSYGVMSISEGQLEIKGIGREENRILRIK
ncbi:MAG: manganese-dependent ADP-ribose/CDP-alcohol diphosphatase [Saprospiraceae bacterium]|jgi:manganese-dependent ADP-ribose/CDP-alcohol diphosphatase